MNHTRRGEGVYETRGGAEGVEERMPRRGAKGAPDCVGSHMRAHGSGLFACEAYGRPNVEARGAKEGESVVSGILPEEFEEIDRLVMGEVAK